MLVDFDSHINKTALPTYASSAGSAAPDIEPGSVLLMYSPFYWRLAFRLVFDDVLKTP